MLEKRKLGDELDNLSTESSKSEEDMEGDESPSSEPFNSTLQLIERARLVSILKQKEMVDSFGLNQPCRLFPPSPLTATRHPTKKKAKKVSFCFVCSVLWNDLCCCLHIQTASSLPAIRCIIYLAGCSNNSFS